MTVESDHTPPPPVRRRKPPTHYGPIQLCNELGLTQWQSARAKEAGLIPPAEAAVILGDSW